MKERDYSPDFLMMWDAYPRKFGKPKSWACWQARIKAGCDPVAMIEGARKYAAYCAASRTETQFIKHCATFLGPNEWFGEDYTINAATQKGAKHGSFGGQDYSKGVGADGSF